MTHSLKGVEVLRNLLQETDQSKFEINYVSKVVIFGEAKNKRPIKTVVHKLA